MLTMNCCNLNLLDQKNKLNMNSTTFILCNNIREFPTSLSGAEDAYSLLESPVPLQSMLSLEKHRDKRVRSDLQI